MVAVTDVMIHASIGLVAMIHLARASNLQV